MGVVWRTSAGMICRCVPNRSHPEGSVEGLVDVVMAGQPVCPQGEEWGLDLKSSKSETKHNIVCVTAITKHARPHIHEHATMFPVRQPHHMRLHVHT